MEVGSHVDIVTSTKDRSIRHATISSILVTIVIVVIVPTVLLLIGNREQEGLVRLDRTIAGSPILIKETTKDLVMSLGLHNADSGALSIDLTMETVGGHTVLLTVVNELNLLVGKLLWKPLLEVPPFNSLDERTLGEAITSSDVINAILEFKEFIKDTVKSLLKLLDQLILFSFRVDNGGLLLVCFGNLL